MTERYTEQIAFLKDPRYHAQSAALLDAALRRQDVAAFLEALTILVKAQGFTAVAHKTGLNRTWLYKAISPSGKPGIHTIVSLLSALGLRLCVKRSTKPPDQH